jgi:Nucleotidyl transferase AbiEii toxin, Type IV TA system
MESRNYKTPEAFRMALEQRIRTAARRPAASINRFRQLLVFDRFLARIFQHFAERAVVKGGLVLELRLDRVRTTKDVDLRLVGDPDGVLAALRNAGALDLGDWLSFLVEPDPEMPTIKNEGMVYDGFRFRGEAQLAGKLYGDPFGIDVAFADILTSEPDIVDGSGFFEFIGIASPKLRIYPRGEHVAEKLHAYTQPRERENSRVKDLPDFALLAMTGPFESSDLRNAIEATFSFRGTHPIPRALPAPPEGWRAVYERMAREDDLPWATLDAVYEVARSFLDPVLGRRAGTWDPDAWRWM